MIGLRLRELKWLIMGLLFMCLGVLSIFPFLVLFHLGVYFSIFFLGGPENVPFFDVVIFLLRLECGDMACDPTVTTYVVGGIISFLVGATLGLSPGTMQGVWRKGPAWLRSGIVFAVVSELLILFVPMQLTAMLANFFPPLTPLLIAAKCRTTSIYYNTCWEISNMLVFIAPTFFFFIGIIQNVVRAKWRRGQTRQLWRSKIPGWFRIGIVWMVVAEILTIIPVITIAYNFLIWPLLDPLYNVDAETLGNALLDGVDISFVGRPVRYFVPPMLFFLLGALVEGWRERRRMKIMK